MSTVGERLKGERIRLGYSIRKFAEAAGVATSSQTRYESNENVPGSDYYNRISELGAEIFWIMRGSKEDDEVREKRAAMYPPEVRELIDNYMLCTDEVKASLRALAKNAANQKRKAVADFKKKRTSKGRGNA
jgi:transcriptional regulator with XRE-family HTH domain